MGRFRLRLRFFRFVVDKIANLHIAREYRIYAINIKDALTREIEK